MLDEKQEQSIAQGLREGKVEAWQALYDAYAERVWRGVARLMGPDGAEVADIVQETMMAAARSARTFDPDRGRLWTWLWGIAHNQAALFWRKKDCQQRLSRSFTAVARREAGEGSGTAGPADVLAAAELSILVRAALARVSADHAALLSARYLDGDSVSQIAQQERCTEVAVRSKLARAREAFRAVFDKYFQDPTEKAEAKHEPK